MTKLTKRQREFLEEELDKLKRSNEVDGLLSLGIIAIVCIVQVLLFLYNNILGWIFLVFVVIISAFKKHKRSKIEKEIREIKFKLFGSVSTKVSGDWNCEKCHKKFLTKKEAIKHEKKCK